MESFQTKKTVHVGDNTDLIVLLCYYAKSKNHDLIFRPDPKPRSKQQVSKIKKVKSELGEEICDNIFFVHAFLGCDTTSRIFGIGKGTIVKKFVESRNLRQQAEVFNTSNASVDDIVKAGENALVEVLHGRPGEDIYRLRYRKCYKKLRSKKVHVQPQSLPPLKQHCAIIA